MDERLVPFEPGDKTKMNIPNAFTVSSPKLKERTVDVTVPCRLHFMPMDISTLDYMKPGGGGFGISSDVFETSCRIRINKNNKIRSRHTIAIHIASVLKEIIGFEEGLDITIDPIKMRHVGYSSSQGITISTGVAINELFGNPLRNHDLRMIIAENYVEDQNGKVVWGLESGLAPALAMYGGFVVVDESLDILETIELPDDYYVATYLPNKEKMVKTNGSEGIKIRENNSEFKNEADLNDAVMKVDHAIAHKKWEILRGDLVPALKKKDFHNASKAMKKLAKMYYRNWLPIRYGKNILDDIIFFTENGLMSGVSSMGPAVFLFGRQEDIQKMGRYIEKNKLCDGGCMYGKAGNKLTIRKGKKEKQYTIKDEYG